MVLFHTKEGIKLVIEAEREQKRSRVVVMVDGFNLYHSLDFFEDGVTPNDCLRYRKYRWLNLWKLALCYVRPKTEELTSVTYFTTLAHWNEGKVFRHNLYIRAQMSQGVFLLMGKFKNKQVICKSDCKRTFTSWEEKQTDVNIARSIIEAAYLDTFDRLILVSGDSDQIPAVAFVKEYFPEKRITVVVPIGRSAIELKELAHSTERMKEDHLKRSQLDNKVLVAGGEYVQKPATWN